jgi:hypothetical protein
MVYKINVGKSTREINDKKQKRLTIYDIKRETYKTSPMVNLWAIQKDYIIQILKNWSLLKIKNKL